MPYKDPKMRRLMSDNYKKNNKEKSAETTKRWRKKNPEKNKTAAWKAFIKREYSLTPEQYQQIIKNQNGICPLCLKQLGASNTIAMDHCHKSKKIRQILHKKCNSVLGFAEDNPFILSRAIAYLYKHNDEDITKEFTAC